MRFFRRRRRQGRGHPRVASVVVLLVLAVAFSATGYWWYKSRVESPSLEDPLNVVVLGIDRIEGAKAQRSDTILVASLRENDLRVLALPRDLRVKYPDGRVEKINAAYAHGGAELARHVIANFLGVELRYYAVIDYDGFEKLIDLVGGVTVTVPQALKYTDHAQKLTIDIPAGRQKLTGKAALGYVRYRDEKTGDLGRLQRQRQLWEAFLREGLPQISLSRWQEIVSTAQQYVKTNIPPVIIYRWSQRLQGLKPEMVQIKQVPGEPLCKPKPVGCYIEPDPVRTAPLVAKMIKRLEVVTADEVRIKVLNGAGVAGLARRVGERLQHEGFTVVHIGNADRLDYAHSYIIDISGNAQKIQLLRERPWRSPVQVVRPEEVRDIIKGLAAKGVTGQDADALLILGQDFQLQEEDDDGS
ncbi:MAG: LCP family protein [Candidatus Bipolaricaulota bacterium]|nr:LCP family protein [Candidatus Bipolaricaulota bacterium]MCS7274274.1 LCP family protein [Candidatus Bipolaricaulota bacterium]MDW8111475.1 LCP family protein [Candidatus Bipolaricaulota bacterium]MDW8329382.1 LCP family protein [Candidatus Bipolaricaulota bacterium]